MEESDPATFIGLYLGISLLLFVASALLLDGDSVVEKDRKWVGRIGLWSPLWPLLIVYVTFAFLRHAYRTVRDASREDEQ